MNLNRKIRSILVQSNYRPTKKKHSDFLEELEEFLEAKHKEITEKNKKG